MNVAGHHQPDLDLDLTQLLPFVLGHYLYINKINQVQYETLNKLCEHIGLVAGSSIQITQPQSACMATFQYPFKKLLTTTEAIVQRGNTAYYVISCRQTRGPVHNIGAMTHQTFLDLIDIPTMFI